METVYSGIAARTGGNLYIGVVGPVRTGKSTLVKRIMEMLVLPHITDPHRQERARDELPQSGSGRSIMTTEPKFVPEEAVEITPDGVTRLRLRLIDSVGYLVEGATGATEEGEPRMVTTPWFDREIPMTQAAELGTRKVMDEHCSVGLVVTTDGTVTDIPRSAYREAEQRAIRDMQATGKPYLVIINTREPGGDSARALQQQLKADCGVDAMIADCQGLDTEGLARLLQNALLAFPLQALYIHMPRWVEALEPEHPIKAELYRSLRQQAGAIACLAGVEAALAPIGQLPQVADLSVRQIDPATGTVSCVLTFPDALFYQVLSAKAGIAIRDDAQLLQLLTELSRIQAEYSKISDALSAVQATGYGIVMPAAADMTLEAPEPLRKNGAYGIRLKARAPSIHMIRVDLDTEITPIVGDEKQSQDLVERLRSEDAAQLWQSNIFGKSVSELIQDGMNAKLSRMPDEVREKFRGTLCRIINDGANGLICLIL